MTKDEYVYEIATLFAGIFLAQVSPGPNMMAIASISFGSGRSSAMATALGIATGVFLWCILFSFGIGGLLKACPELLVAMQLLGGGYLFWLGLRSAKSLVVRGAEANGIKGVTMPVGAAYRRGLLVVLTNPKAALMWAAISMFLASSHLSMAYFLAIGVVASLSAAMIYGSYALLFSTGLAVRGYRRFFKVIDGLFGLLFGALGAKLLWGGIRQIAALRA